MKELQVFNNKEFGDVRVVMSENNEPLFCLADVCAILDLRQGDVSQRLDEGVVSTQPILMLSCRSCHRDNLREMIYAFFMYNNPTDEYKDAVFFTYRILSDVLKSIADLQARKEVAA